MREIVINTGPDIGLVVATSSLNWMSELYRTVWVPYEVEEEISAGGAGNPELAALRAASNVIQVLPSKAVLPQALSHELDLGEASVIHTAIERHIDTVAIDEKAGRRIARLHGLKVTGSLGILIKAKEHGIISSLTDCVSEMLAKGIWISDGLVHRAITAVGETSEKPGS